MPDNPLLSDDRHGAILDDSRTYRYRLWRTWDVDKPACAFIGLNPSTADETEDDPTLRRCIGYARAWGYGTVELGNLFGLRATDPAELREASDPVGPENDDHLRDICRDAKLVVAAWGNDGELMDRAREVCRLLDDHDLHALVVNQTGHPKHPLYCRKAVEPQPFGYDRA